MRYLGNKTRMLSNIDYVLQDNQVQGHIFCDLFAGSGSVGDYFKGKYSIVANDFLFSMNIINRAKLENGHIPSFDMFRNIYHTDPFTYFNEKTYIMDSQYFIANNYSPLGSRQFFTSENAIKIDGIRIEIEELYKNLIFDIKERNFLLASLLESVMGISNTTGTYEAFLKTWDKRAFKSLCIEPLNFVNTDEVNVVDNVVYNIDSNELIRKINGDILYIDPPYTITEYDSAYHLLESIAKYDYPDIAGVTGRRKNKKQKTKYTKKECVLENFEDLFRQAQFKHILVSYSTQGLVSIDSIVSIARRFAVNNEVKVYEFPYKEYKNINSSKKSMNLKEVIIYFEKNIDIIRSPLNYTGSKYGIFNELLKVMPKHISTFVDVMGGAFNVGVNIIAEHIVYNELLPHTFQIINLLLNEDKKYIINKIECIIKEYNLQKCNKNMYLKLRSDYNTSKDIFKLFVLHMYCFQNQMRFNNKLEFNSPVGNCSYNNTLAERIYSFYPKTNSICFLNYSYANIKFQEYDKDSVFYFDPPYFITNATYNDGKRGFIGWNADEETKLLEYITELHLHGYKFILSNVLYHNDSSNYILIEWIKTHHFNIKYIDNVGSKNSRNEVVIYNFDWRYI